MEFKDILKDLRTKNNMTQQELADVIFVSTNEIEEWETGLGLPDEGSIKEIMKYFHVDRDYLFPNDNKEETINKVNKRRKSIFASKVAYIIEILIFIIGVQFVLSLGYGVGLGITNKGNKDDYVNKTFKIPGYYIEVGEGYQYRYINEDGEEKTTGDVFEDNFEESINGGELIWKEKTAYWVDVHKRLGFIYNKRILQTDRIYLYDSSDESDTCVGGFYIIKDKDGTYHYFYDLFAEIYSYSYASEEKLTIEINGVKQELTDDYYFTSLYDLTQDEYKIKICGREVYKKTSKYDD